MRILAIVAHLLCELVSAHRTYAESSLDKRAFSFELLNPVPELYVGPFPLTYCYRNANSRASLESLLLEGFALWQNAPGGIGNVQLAPDLNIICKAGTRSLQIQAAKGVIQATVGYWTQGKQNTPTFDPDGVPVKGAGTLVTFMAHELGHVLGLYHEHQRPDAANHVAFKCENLKDYDQFKKNGYDMQELCTSLTQAGVNNFYAADFIPRRPDPTDHAGGAFDFDSIMIYSSLHGSESPKLPLQKATLVRADNGKNFERVGTPSATDTARVRAMYSATNAGPATQAVPAVQPRAQLDSSYSTNVDPVWDEDFVNDSLGLVNEEDGPSVGTIGIPYPIAVGSLGLGYASAIGTGSTPYPSTLATRYALAHISSTS